MKKEGLVLTLSWRVQSVMVGRHDRKSMKQPVTLHLQLGKER